MTSSLIHSRPILLSTALASLLLGPGAPSRALDASAAPSTKKYAATWESLDARPIPTWFTDAKFGIFIHWGVYSVPAWSPKGSYAEWYWNSLQDANGPTRKFHDRAFGKEFPYESFAPLFRAELFDPGRWADLFANSGARYVVLTSKHHEGFALWPSADASRDWGRPWNSVETGPKRDLLGDLSQAVRAKGLKMGFYYSLYEWFNPLYKSNFARFRDDHYFPQFKDVVTRYKPSIIFADGEWEHTSAEWRSPELLAWLYNDSGAGDDLVINDRWGSETRGKHGGYYTTEYGGMTGFQAGPGHPWEESRGMGASYGYNRNEDIEDYRSTADLLRLLVGTVGLGGNLLLDIGPTADGRIPVIMQERLLGMGEWLKANGDSVYGASAGPYGARPLPWGAMTAKPGRVFVHLFRRPGNTLELPGFASRVTKAYWLADPAKKPVAVKAAPKGETGLVIPLPERLPDAAVSTLVLAIEGEPKVDLTIRQRANGAVDLDAAAADLHGSKLKLEQQAGGTHIGYWLDPAETVSWTFTVSRPGAFEVGAVYAAEPNAGGAFTMTLGDQAFTAAATPTGSWDAFQEKRVGRIRIPKAGTYTLTLKPQPHPDWRGMNLRAVHLLPAR